MVARAFAGAAGRAWSSTSPPAGLDVAGFAEPAGDGDSERRTAREAVASLEWREPGTGAFSALSGSTGFLGGGETLRELGLGESIPAGEAGTDLREAAGCEGEETAEAGWAAEEGDGVAVTGSGRKRKNRGTASTPTTRMNAPSSAGIKKLDRP